MTDALAHTIRRHYETGATLADCAERFGIPAVIARAHIKAVGGSIRPPGARTPGPTLRETLIARLDRLPAPFTAGDAIACLADVTGRADSVRRVLRALATEGFLTRDGRRYRKGSVPCEHEIVTLTRARQRAFKATCHRCGVTFGLRLV